MESCKISGMTSDFQERATRQVNYGSGLQRGLLMKGKTILSSFGSSLKDDP